MPGGLASSWLQTHIVRHKCPMVLRPWFVASGFVPLSCVSFLTSSPLRRQPHFTCSLSLLKVPDCSPGGYRLLAATERVDIVLSPFAYLSEPLACERRDSGIMHLAPTLGAHYFCQPLDVYMV